MKETTKPMNISLSELVEEMLKEEVLDAGEFTIEDFRSEYKNKGVEISYSKAKIILRNMVATGKLKSRKVKGRKSRVNAYKIVLP